MNQEHNKMSTIPILVNEFDGSGTDAGVEERLVRRSLAPAHATNVYGIKVVIMGNIMFLNRPNE